MSVIERFLADIECVRNAEALYGVFYKTTVTVDHLKDFARAYLKASGRWAVEGWDEVGFSSGFTNYVNFKRSAPYTFYIEEPPEVRGFLNTVHMCEQFIENYYRRTLPTRPMQAVDDGLNACITQIGNLIDKSTLIAPKPNVESKQP
jgi:hypothetical protein